MLYVGIDPGKSGCISVLDEDGDWLTACRLDQTEYEIANFLYDISEIDPGQKMRILIEKVHAMPKQGVTSTFTFGRNYGFLRGCLFLAELPFDDVTPHVWQTKMKCKTKGDKNITKARAQQLFPGVKITHRNADSILIAEYARRFTV